MESEASLLTPCRVPSIKGREAERQERQFSWKGSPRQMLGMTELQLDLSQVRDGASPDRELLSLTNILKIRLSILKMKLKNLCG